MTVDVSSDAEPSWEERWFASVLLDAKIRSIRPKKLSPLTQADEDLEHGSELYQQQCGFCQWSGPWKDGPVCHVFLSTLIPEGKGTRLVP
jgi:hypothetical protein